jgi:hypothetical protein
MRQYNESWGCKMRFYTYKTAVPADCEILVRLICESKQCVDDTSRIQLLLISGDDKVKKRYELKIIFDNQAIKLPKYLNHGQYRLVLMRDGLEVDYVTLSLMSVKQALFVNMFDIGLQYRILSSRYLDESCVSVLYRNNCLASNYYDACGYAEYMLKEWEVLGYKCAEMGYKGIAKACNDRANQIYDSIGMHEVYYDGSDLGNAINECNEMEYRDHNCIREYNKNGLIGDLVSKWQMLDYFEAMIESKGQVYDYIIMLLMLRSEDLPEAFIADLKCALFRIIDVLMQNRDLIKQDSIKSMILDSERIIFMRDTCEYFVIIDCLYSLVLVSSDKNKYPIMSALFASIAKKSMIEKKVDVATFDKYMDYMIKFAFDKYVVLFDVSEYELLGFFGEIVDEWFAVDDGEFIVQLHKRDVINIRRGFGEGYEMVLGKKYWSGIKKYEGSVTIKALPESVIERINILTISDDIDSYPTVKNIRRKEFVIGLKK